MPPVYACRVCSADPNPTAWQQWRWVMTEDCSKRTPRNATAWHVASPSSCTGKSMPCIPQQQLHKPRQLLITASACPSVRGLHQRVALPSASLTAVQSPGVSRGMNPQGKQWHTFRVLRSEGTGSGAPHRPQHRSAHTHGRGA